MGYTTQYRLDVSYTVAGKPVKLVDESPLLEVIKQLRKENEEAAYSLEDDGSASGGESRWYEHQADMKAFSAKHPGVLFTLSGEGEENGDMWKEYYLDGKVQVEKAQVQIASFDPAKLK